MARPKKNDDEKRTERYNLRYTVAERETVRAHAVRAGLDEMEFHRRRALGVALPPARSGSDPALVAALNNYALALSKIGNNLNQLAAATHQGRDFTKYWREIGDETQVDLVKIRNALNAALEGLAE